MKGLEDIVGGKWSFTPDLKEMATLIKAHIEKKERKLYDMEDRRALSID